MSETTLEILDPWTMPYLEYEKEFIDELNCEITAKHPLYRKQLFVVAVRKNPWAVIFETDEDKPIYALVFLRRLVFSKRKVDPKTRLLKDYAAIQKFIRKEHDRWIEKCKAEGCYDTID